MSTPTRPSNGTSPPSARLAFDGKGDLLVAGGGAFGLYEMTRTGKLRFVENFRGDGYWGSIAEGPRGIIVLSVRNGTYSFSSSGTIRPIGPSEIAIDNVLGRTKQVPHQNMFVGGDGVAAAKNGDIYADTNTANTFTSVSAILELRPNGEVIALWKSSKLPTVKRAS